MGHPRNSWFRSHPSASNEDPTFSPRPGEEVEHPANRHVDGIVRSLGQVDIFVLSGRTLDSSPGAGLASSS